MNKMKEINRMVVYSKLDNIHIYHNHIRCNDIIETLSEAKSRDKRLINDWGETEIIIRSVDVDGTLRKCRMFTPLGVIKYVHVGKIYSYVNVCNYFKTEPINKKNLELLKCMNKDKIFETKKILKWLFERRKQTKTLGKTVELNQLKKWINDYEFDDIDEDRKQMVLDMLNIP
jgi:hypothetical protein